jgi:hypothetical protein
MENTNQVVEIMFMLSCACQQDKNHNTQTIVILYKII